MALTQPPACGCSSSGPVDAGSVTCTDGMWLKRISEPSLFHAPLISRAGKPFVWAVGTGGSACQLRISHSATGLVTANASDGVSRIETDEERRFSWMG